jgi:hypothetical protein
MDGWVNRMPSLVKGQGKGPDVSICGGDWQLKFWSTIHKGTNWWWWPPDVTAFRDSLGEDFTLRPVLFFMPWHFAYDEVSNTGGLGALPCRCFHKYKESFALYLWKVAKGPHGTN